MKSIFFKIFIALCLVAICLVAVSCNGDGATDTSSDVTTESVPSNATYTVYVKDSVGNVPADVIVKLLRDGESVSMKRLTDGKAVFADLEKASYTVELSFPNPDVKLTWSASDCVLTEEKLETTITLYNKLTESSELYADSIVSGEYRAYTAYVFTEGASFVELSGDGERNYFIFFPERAGKYKIDFVSDDENMSIGYYGGTFMVQKDNLAEMDGSGVLINVKSGMVGGSWVIGIDTDSAKNCTLVATRISDPELSAEESLQWTAYTESNVREYFVDCINFKATNYVKFDLTNPALKAVYNENDGYYHLNTADGAIIFIELGEAIDNIGKIDSIKTICEHQRMGEYVYDNNGKMIAKYSFNELFEQYSFGKVPLTEKLAYAIKSFGKNYSWWDATSSVNIFGTDISRIVLDNAYLVACGYYTDAESIDGVAGSANPAEVTADGVNVRVENGKELFFSAEANKTLTVTGAGKGLQVKYNSQTYTADAEGKIVISLVNGTTFSVTNSDQTDFISISVA